MQSAQSQGCRANLSHGRVGAVVLLRFGPVVLKARLISQVNRLDTKHKGSDRTVRLSRPAFVAQVFYTRAYHPALCPDFNGNLETIDADLRVDRVTGALSPPPAMPKTVLVFEDDLYGYLPEFDIASVRLDRFGWEFTDGERWTHVARTLRREYESLFEGEATRLPDAARGGTKPIPVRQDFGAEIQGMFQELSDRVDPAELEGMRVKRRPDDD